MGNILNFLGLWLEVLVYLVAASICARLASATVDYISRGQFREFLFGMEQHSLGEPWPDVLGVTITLVITALFMLGLERSTLIIILLFLALCLNFVFFATIGSLHTINTFQKWTENFKVHSVKAVLKAAAFCSFAFLQSIPMSSKRNRLKICIFFIIPVAFYTVTAIIFSLMTRYRELVGTAVPLIQVFENRDVDWARPAMAVFTVSVVCLLLTEIMPNVFYIFVKLASKEWRVFVSSIQFRSQDTGAPVLAIFAAGSLAAILTFACPLSHLIKLLNTTSLVKSVIFSCQMMISRYKPEMTHSDFQVFNTNVHYSKLNQNTNKGIDNQSQQNLLTEKLKNVFRKKPTYIHRLSSPKNIKSFQSFSSRSLNTNKQEEQDYLLHEKLSLTMSMEYDTNSDTEANEMNVISCSDDEEFGSSTDIDVIVEEYKESVKVAAVGGKFNEKKPPTKLTSILVMVCLFFIVLASINISLYVYNVIQNFWPNLLAILSCTILIIAMPSNTSEKSKPSLLPSWLFSTFYPLSITANILLASTIIADIWEGIVFWTLAGN